MASENKFEDEIWMNEIITSTNGKDDGDKVGDIADGSHSEESLFLRSEFLLQ